MHPEAARAVKRDAVPDEGIPAPRQGPPPLPPQARPIRVEIDGQTRYMTPGQIKTFKGIYEAELAMARQHPGDAIAQAKIPVLEGAIRRLDSALASPQPGP